MVVAVVAMRVMQVAIDKVVHVVPMRHGLVPATGAVDVVGLVARAHMRGRARVRVLAGHRQRVLVDVILVRVVQVALQPVGPVQPVVRSQLRISMIR